MTPIDFRPIPESLDFDLTGFHALADYIRDNLPNRETEKDDE